jgi:hypothetical protein
MQDGDVLRFARVMGLAVLMLAGCGDDESPAPADAGGSGGQGGGSPDASNTTGLGDDVAGKPCSDSGDCDGATCATTVLGTMLGAAPVSAPGGYCTGTCMMDSECGDGGACLGALPGIDGSCFATCAAMDDCRDGYVCAAGLTLGGLVIPDTCRPAPATDQLGDDVAGKMCSEAADCSGGECLTMRQGLAGSYELPGGYCSGACLEDAHCGAGGVCLAALLGGAGSCYEGCDTDVDCTRDGYRCRPLLGETRGCNVAADPLPDGTVGKMCSADADCGGGTDTCANALPQAGLPGALGATDAAPGGYCSQPCLEDVDCGANGACIGGALGGSCFVKCSTGTDCRTGYVCEDRAVMMLGPDAGTPEPLLVCAPVPVVDEDGGI